MAIGWASTAYGARKNTNATWYATTPPATPFPSTIDGAEQHGRARVQQHTPHRQPGEPRERRDRGDPSAVAARTRPARGDHEDPDEREHATGARDREQQLLGDRQVEARLRAREHAERDEAHDDHDAAADRRGRGDRELPLRVQECRSRSRRTRRASPAARRTRAGTSRGDVARRRRARSARRSTRGGRAAAAKTIPSTVITPMRDHA